MSRSPQLATCNLQLATRTFLLITLLSSLFLASCAAPTQVTPSPTSYVTLSPTPLTSPAPPPSPTPSPTPIPLARPQY
ncbi:MAG: hypothetical protein MUO30_11505, partial [Anaerolineales bacterium]|nr:hypothetical protein [Anaerolineales bacterium]